MLKRLIEGIINKDEKTMVYILQTYGNQLLHFCMLQGLKKEDAKDVIQDVLSELHSKVLQFDQKRCKEFGNWLITIAVNKSKDFMKRRNRVLLKSNEQIELEIFSRLDTILDKNAEFEDASIPLLYLFSTSNLSNEYLAMMFDVSLSSIKRYKLKLKKHLKKKMRKEKQR